MMMKLFKKKNNFKKKDFVFNPNLYWRIALFCMLIIITLSSFFGYHLFTQINQEPVLPVAQDDGQIPTVDKDRILKVLQYFSIREQKSSEILNSPSPVIDPSL